MVKVFDRELELKILTVRKNAVYRAIGLISFRIISNQIILPDQQVKTELSGGLTPVCQIFKRFVHVKIICTTPVIEICSENYFEKELQTRKYLGGLTPLIQMFMILVQAIFIVHHSKNIY
jgi:hypothetical protein